MTRRFLDDIRNDVTTILVTNGETTAAEMRGMMLDMLDSTIQDEAVIASNVPSLAVPTAITFIPLTTGIYDAEVGGDADFITVDIINGTIKSSTTAGFTYELEGKVSFQDLGVNTPINFAILRNGIQQGFIAEMTGGGNNRPRTASFSHVVLSAESDAIFTIGVQTPNGVQNIDINSIAMSCTIQPTNNP